MPEKIVFEIKRDIWTCTGWTDYYSFRSMTGCELKKGETKKFKLVEVK